MDTLTTALEPDVQLVDRAILACKQGDIGTALELLAKAIARDGCHEAAWLWLSGLVTTDAERRFCLNRVLQINPQHPSARQGIKLLPADVEPQPPVHVRPDIIEGCAFPGCRAAKRPGSPYCFAHWMAIYRPATRSASPPAMPTDSAPAASLSASALAERLGVSTQALLAICSELGWIVRGEQGWLATPAGTGLGAVQQQHPQTNVPFVHWPLSILDHPALPRAIRRIRADHVPAKASGERALRERTAATYRTTDGHMVRCPAELAIDNWLYAANLVHAYERPLPSEEEAYCDFFLPAGRVYIEYWGKERDALYLERTVAKRALYERHGLHLVALHDEHVISLDTCLPILLAQFGMVQ